MSRLFRTAAGGRATVRPHRRPLTCLALAAAGLALLCGCASSSPAQVPTDGGAVPTATGTVRPGGAPATGEPPGTAAVRPLARSEPARLRIPAIGVDTAVMSLGLAADGTVRVPPIAAHAPAGWYDGSPTPGQTGPSVILGHVTVGKYGDGVFLHLDRMHKGDTVMVARKDGTVATFTVDSVQTVAKSHFPTSAVYGNVDHPALRLITCGGTRVTGGGGYTDNVIVYASLATGS
ncbi:class F sortase [Streptomyces sp. NBC_01476]|uniref:class F sortase n=1 Tax=Streptomyces sp. NBC_01476 TaxID=2903881 RepID=UPI002E379EAB|nr:class F sortase [Streptomyces sp. NBC_01476]